MRLFPPEISELVQSNYALILATLVGYFIIFCVISWAAKRRLAKDVGDYVVASRNLGWVVVTFTMYASVLSGVGMAGIPGTIWLIGAPFVVTALTGITISTALLWYLGPRIWVLGKEYNFTTPGDLLGEYYQSDLVRLYTVIASVLYNIAYIVAQLLAGGILLNVLSGNFISFQMGIWIITIIVIIHVALAGLRGMSLRKKRMAFVAATQGHFAGVSMAASPALWLSRFFYPTRLFDINQPTADIVKGLNEWDPRVVAGYAGALRMLAEVKERGELTISPRLLTAGGEPLTKRDQLYIENVFGTHVRNTYAASEHLFMGFDLHHGPGMYLLEDNLIFELKDDCTLVTNLFNKTLPLIRYKMDDVLKLAPPQVRGYGSYTVIDEVVGRQEEAPVFHNEDGEEDWIHPIVIVEFYVKGLKAFQLHIVDRDSFRFHVVLDSHLNDVEAANVEREIGERMRALLTQKRMNNVRFEIHRVDELGPDPKTGKFRLIVPAVA